MEPMALLEVRGLVKDYPRVRALDGLEVDVPAGAVGLLGPNGAGKSTLIRILLGFTAPDAGSVRLLGLDPGREALEIRRQVGLMPETDCLPLHLDAVDAVVLAARLSGLPAVDALQRAHRVLDYVGLREERYRPMGTYSTGMKQKAKLAQAIVHHPRILLLDEPTAGLDPRAREEMLQLLRDLARKRGIPVVLSTHILPDVEAVCDRVVILHRGKLVREGPLAELTAAGGAEYEAFVKGDRARFLEALGRLGVPAEDGGGTIRLRLPEGTAAVLRAAAESGVQLRRLAPVQRSLEEIFTRLVAG
jgi:ABC-2 type transport system ATP-binding protein